MMTERMSGVITGLEAQVKRRERISVFVDGEFAAGVHGDVAAALGLQIGQPVETSQVAAWLAEEEKHRAQDAALAYLGTRARSRTEVRRRLVRAGYEADLIEEVLDSLAQIGYLNDQAFSQAWVAARSQGRIAGRTRLAADLRQRGVAGDVVESALASRDDGEEFGLALQLARERSTRQTDADPIVRRRRLAGFLQRRGFSWPICLQVLDQVLGEEEDISA